MVQDSDPQVAATAACRTCPRCRSPRTEITGGTNGGRSADFRCHNCDERFSSSIDRRASDADNVTDEVEAIRIVGRALAQLPDPASRMRVLRWAAERFQIDIALGPVAMATVSTVRTASFTGPDLSLSTEGLFELFATPKAQDRVPAIESDLLTIDADLVTGAKPVAEIAPVAECASAAEETAAVEPASKSGSMLHNFVDDFQRLANDCQTLFAS